MLRALEAHQGLADEAPGLALPLAGLEGLSVCNEHAPDGVGIPQQDESVPARTHANQAAVLPVGLHESDRVAEEGACGEPGPGQHAIPIMKDVCFAMNAALAT